MVSPPSSQPAAWRMKLAPHWTADSIETVLSVMAWPSAILEELKAPEQRKGRLVGARIGAQRVGHGGVEHQRRVGVDVAENDAISIHELAAEHDPGHLDRILGPVLGRDRAHEGLVGQAQMRRDHVEMAL